MDDCKNGPFSTELLVTTSATSYTISSLTPGITCRFRMIVANIIGSGPYSDILSVTFAVVPDAPLAPTYLSRSGGDLTTNLSPFIEIEWDAPYDTGAAPILGYKVQASVGTGSYSTIYDGSSNAVQKSFKFQNLIAGQTYNFIVAARNVKGYSPMSPPIQIIAATMPPQLSPPSVTTVVPNG